MDRKSILEQRSKIRLKKDIKKKIETTMIGALASVEKYFGSLWGFDAPNPTQEQAQMKEVFEELRSEILDKGNAQIRNAESEVENYDVTWNKYHINIPIQRNL
jgi:hypothetical protein|tara:strand:+ start:373 stop:681 length:309 start_codon:yes stop_codon:yes gene_type:complete